MEYKRQPRKILIMVQDEYSTILIPDLQLGSELVQEVRTESMAEGSPYNFHPEREQKN